MALVVADRVQQTATANTTVSFTLTGSVTGYQSFAVVGNGNTTYYSSADQSGNWEVGIGTYSTTGPTLTRTTILSSSNSGLAVTFPGSLNVWVDYPAEKAVYEDASNNVTVPNTLTGGNVEASNGVMAMANTVTSSVVIPSGYNVISISPWSVASGATFTLPSGSRQVIL